MLEAMTLLPSEDHTYLTTYDSSFSSKRNHSHHDCKEILQQSDQVTSNVRKRTIANDDYITTSSTGSWPNLRIHGRGRKRSRVSPLGTGRSLTQRSIASDTTLGADLGTASPPPLAEDRYHLSYKQAGESHYSCRLNSAENHGTPNEDAYFRRQWSEVSSPCASAADIVSDGRTRMPTEINTWRMMVFKLATVVASHMWHFCKEGAFRGFRAGGGIAFGWKDKERNEMDWNPERDTVLKQDEGSPASLRDRPIALNHLPAKNDEMLDEWTTVETISSKAARSSHNTPPCSNKRQHISCDGAWVVVPHRGNNHVHQPGTRSRPTTPLMRQRKTHKSPLSQKKGSRPYCCSHSHSRAQQRDQSVKDIRASSTGTASPITLSDRHNQHERPYCYEHSFTASPLHTRHTAHLSAQKRESTSNSPLSAEARRYQSRVRREERRADASMRKVNEQLRDMIREGQEALESRVDVTFGDEDEDAF